MSNSEMFDHDFVFDNFSLSADGVLSAHGQDVAIPPKELHVLVVLLESEGKLVSKDLLIDKVWGNYPVGDESLTRCIYSLRRILRESKVIKYIETVYGRGYRFCQPVTLIPRRLNVQRGKLAVLPFRGGAVAESAELHAQMLDYLSDMRLPGLYLVPALLTRGQHQLEDVLALCQRLSLDYYLSGEFCLDRGEQVLQLEWVAAANHHLLSRETLKRDGYPTWMLRLQAWCDGLHGRLSGGITREAPPASATEVQLSHVMARRMLRVRQRGDLSPALQFLQMGLAQDSQHVPSLVASAETYLAMAMHGDLWPDSAFRQARTVLDKALNIAPDHPDALGVLDWLSCLSGEPVPETLRHAEGASAEHYLYQAMCVTLRGDAERGYQLINACLMQDSYLAPAQLFKLWLLYIMGRGEEAVSFGQIIIRQGGQSPRFYGVLAVVLGSLGRVDEAQAYATQSMEMAPAAMPELIHYAMVQSLSDRGPQRVLLRQLADEAESHYRCPGLLASLALELGEDVLLHRLLQLAVHQRCVWLPFVRVSPRMAAFIAREAGALHV